MKREDFDALIVRLKQELIGLSEPAKVGIVGHTSTSLDLMSTFSDLSQLGCVTGVYVTKIAGNESTGMMRSLQQLREDNPQIVIIASDEDKEALLADAVPYLTAETRVLVGGYAHFGFYDALFAAETANALIPSFANGYPNSLIHIYQCLKNAARLNLNGIVAEFGMFKGGTTMLMSRFVEKLGRTWKIYGFDSFAGFPPRRSPLDMYAHPDCVFLDEPAVRRIFEGRNVEIVAGDIVETAKRIEKQPVVLAFVDTDNFTSANAVLDTIQSNVVRGGAIVFDHFTGRNRFLYTLGERFAAKRLLDDERYFNLHDTGVFLRQL